MARQNIVPNPSQKLFEAYMDFSGGLNSEIANDRLKDTEFPIFENIDLSGRASAKRRYGRDLLTSIAGNAQGMQWFYRSGQPAPDLFVAISGKLYVANNGSPSSLQQVPLTNADGTTFTFQSTLPIEMVQYKTSLFVATGTKLLEVAWGSNGWAGSPVVAYKPSSLEVTNQGLNALADNPASWITDLGAATVKIDSITCSPPNPVINQPADFTVHVEKPSNLQLNYAWAWRHTGSGTYAQLGTYQNNNASLTLPDTGAVDIQVQTSKVNTNIGTWDDNQADGWVNMIGGSQWDSADGVGCGIVQGTTPCAEDGSLKSWKDYSTPIDLSAGDTIDWYWTSYSSSTSSGDTTPGAFQINFYTAGNLTTPVLTIKSPGGEMGRGIGGGWIHDKVTYDNSITGLNNIVRVGICGYETTSGNYIANSTGSYTINSNDTTTRVDNILAYNSNSSTTYSQTFQIVGVANPVTDPTTYANIQTCRMVRYDEGSDTLILGKDSVYPGQIYVSNISNPRYFPVNGRIDFSHGTNDPITSFLRFQNYYMVFTKTSISVIEDLGSSSYSVKQVHSEIGCVADRSAKVVNNEVYFLSAEGIFKVTPHPYRPDIMQVSRIDWQMKSTITPDTDACAITYDNQYWICFPSKLIIYRMYYDRSVWVKDTSSKLNISQFIQYGNEMYQLSADGNIYTTNKTRYDDAGEAYTMSLESKYFDLDASFNFKKLKRAYFLAHSYSDHDINYNVTVTADGQTVLNPVETTFPIVNGVASIQQSTVPNVQFYGGTAFGTWLLGYSPFGAVNVSAKVLHVHGKARRVKVAFTHSDPVACELFGFGLEFKMKKPY